MLLRCSTAACRAGATASSRFVRAEQKPIPVIGFLSSISAGQTQSQIAAFQ